MERVRDNERGNRVRAGMRLSPLQLHACMYVCVRFIACMQLAWEGALLLSSIYLSSGAFVCIYFYVNASLTVCV